MTLADLAKADPARVAGVTGSQERAANLIGAAKERIGAGR
jgi:hypothetical protein